MACLLKLPLQRICPPQDDAQAAAVEAAGRSPSPLPPVDASAGASPDLVRLLHQRRTQLVERETALQRWAVALELEAQRQATAAKALRAQEDKVARLAQESGGNKEAAAAMLADVQRREAALQREAGELQEAQVAAAQERQELGAERAALEAAAGDLSARASEFGRREQALAASEEQWEAKVAAAEAQLKVWQGARTIGAAALLPACALLRWLHPALRWLHPAHCPACAQPPSAPTLPAAVCQRGGRQGPEGAARAGGTGSQAVGARRCSGRAQGVPAGAADRPGCQRARAGGAPAAVGPGAGSPGGCACGSCLRPCCSRGGSGGAEGRAGAAAG